MLEGGGLIWKVVGGVWMVEVVEWRAKYVCGRLVCVQKDGGGELVGSGI